MNEVTARHRPALCLFGQRHRPGCSEVGEVGRAERKVAHELQITDAEGAELEVADGKAMRGRAPEGFVVVGLDTQRDAGTGIRSGLVVVLLYGITGGGGSVPAAFRGSGTYGQSGLLGGGGGGEGSSRGGGGPPCGGSSLRRALGGEVSVGARFGGDEPPEERWRV